ncbi:pseudouridine synthase [Lachnospiraceae bacterium 62-35]
MEIKKIRLDRFLTEMGVLSRSQAKEAAKKGRIFINGEVEKRTDRKIFPGVDRVMVDGTEIGYKAWEYFMLNKPSGVVSATEDKRYPTVLDLIEEKARRDLFPVGRLDMDTEGLLLITNDGALAHRLLAPKSHVDKVYYARIEGNIPSDGEQLFQEGLVLSDGTKTLPARLQVLEGGGEVCLTIHEGKFHQVKRMFEAIGCKVIYLKRLSMGTLVLDEGLRPGEYRRLTEEELEQLQKC